MRYVKAFAATAIVFLIIDLAWIGLFLRDVYEAQLGSMMRPSASVWAAALFYVGYVAAILYFAIRPALAEMRLATAIQHGAALGAIAYGTYTLTNYAIFERWSVLLVVSDIGWGAFLTAVCAAAGYLAARVAHSR
ncbi:MAG: DUF2177 family protein [Woeseiaceae bacterium]|nr:DUF2177 family protein [Woeseiaceae bacterium]